MPRKKVIDIQFESHSSLTWPMQEGWDSQSENMGLGSGLGFRSQLYHPLIGKSGWVVCPFFALVFSSVKMGIIILTLHSCCWA